MGTKMRRELPPDLVRAQRRFQARCVHRTAAAGRLSVTCSSPSLRSRWAGSFGDEPLPLKKERVVTSKRLLRVILGLACVVSARGADQGDVRSVLDKFRSVRPQAADLAIYQLDWMPTLKAAKEKAAKEERPIFLVVVRNSFGDLRSGHC